MDALLDQLRHFGLNPRPFPDRPPPWPELRAELRGHAPRLAADALGCWYELFQWNYYLWAIRLFEAACEADTGPAEFETFALGARQLLGRFGPRAPVPAAFHEFLAGTAHHNAFDHKRRQPLAVCADSTGSFSPARARRNRARSARTNSATISTDSPTTASTLKPKRGC